MGSKAGLNGRESIAKDSSHLNEASLGAEAGSFPKRHGCDRSYGPDEWLKLPLVGYTVYDDQTLEQRNCACGSTLAIDVTVREAS